MHHFIFPSKDTFITNRPTLDKKNFGVDELLQVGTVNTPLQYLSPTKDYVYTNVVFTGQSVEMFTGTFSGSFAGTIGYATGTIAGSTLWFSASYFTGSVNGANTETSGGVSGSLINGYISGSVTASYVTGLFIGQLTGSVACLTGTGSGIDSRAEPNWITATTQYVDRALLRFDLTEISLSIAQGDIVNPSFFLNLKVCNEYELPITYTIYALPISQSWNMGNGYLSDGGSDKGVNWWYKDNDGGTYWYSSSVSTPRIAMDFISVPGLVAASFAFGGGTWYTTSYCSQSFSYKSSDIDMNITPIVNKWLYSPTIPNEGIMLIQSDELIATGSGFTLKFFSRDTNTIYSPYLDVAWDDSVFSTGSVFTASTQTITVASGITATVQTGSTLSVAGGIAGGFSASAAITITPHYASASNTTFFTSLVQKFTGSFSGLFYVDAVVVGNVSGSNLIFSASYFTGSVDGVNTETSGSVSGSIVSGSITGSIISLNPLGVFAGQLTASVVYLTGTGSGVYLDTNYLAYSGIISGMGVSGNINGLPVVGASHGLITLTSSTVIFPEDIITSYASSPNQWPYVAGYNLSNPTSPYNPLINSFYVWYGPDSWWAGTLPALPTFTVTSSCGVNHTVQIIAGIFDTGQFSGSTFTAYYSNYGIMVANLTGSWNIQALYGSSVTIPLPSGIDPYAYAYVVGTYINGTALGIYTLSGSTSASFDGQFINGTLIGGGLYLQLSGSAYTSSFTYENSSMSSSWLSPLDTDKPFSINVQNLQPQYKAGDIVRIGVFGRKKFPLKYFGMATQQSQYLVPEYLPVSSSYALKDNQTDEIVVNFDNYTRISCEYPNGNYFLVDTTGLSQERYYNVLIRVQGGNEIYTLDTGKTFKITR